MPLRPHKPEIVVRDATSRDLVRLTEFYNDAIADASISWTETPVSLADRRAWWRRRVRSGLPVLVAERDGEVIGTGSFGPFRPLQSHRFTVEHSLYVAPAQRRSGAGTLLLRALIERARGSGMHVIVGGIDAHNVASLAFHVKHGFVEVGRMPEIGQKLGRWRDLVLVQRILEPTRGRKRRS